MQLFYSQSKVVEGNNFELMAARCFYWAACFLCVHFLLQNSTKVKMPVFSL